MDELEPVFPDNLSDETAQALCDVLYALTVACESRYLTQLQRYCASQRSEPVDPEQPWK